MEVWSKYNQELVGIYTIQCAIYMMLLDHMHTFILYIFAMTELISSQKKSSKITVIRKNLLFLIRETDLHQNFSDPRIIENFRNRSAIYFEFKLKISEEKNMPSQLGNHCLSAVPQHLSASLFLFWKNVGMTRKFQSQIHS